MRDGRMRTGGKEGRGVRVETGGKGEDRGAPLCENSQKIPFFQSNEKCMLTLNVRFASIPYEDDGK